ncbi:histone-like nucleoid-structuring protein Lsr2 [Nocardia blacklockiae]|uniref:histone-like nucleoid-structuring protein Lsr2 n=1 Tax=Nocardia blacklockiae TaxID=480036 RepID=UPI001892DB50|nr:Lsr2 family protein [Nocardia blacklockiae]MBF6176773.1 Lsr2 family protein [Nocardia blacklockiae]
MAHRVLVTRVDDLDGESTADETVVFGLDGVTYEIDLSAGNAALLREQLQHWAARARRVRRTMIAARQPTTVTAVQSTAARQWARENGVSVSARGRVPAEVLRAYLDAGRSATD